MVRQIKNFRKSYQKIQGINEKENGWNDRFVYNKLGDNYLSNTHKPFTTRKNVNNYENNINFLRRQFNKVSQKSNKKIRGKSSYKPYQESTNYFPGNKITANSKNRQFNKNKDLQHLYDYMSNLENSYKDNKSNHFDINSINSEILKSTNNSKIENNSKSDMHINSAYDIFNNDIFNTNYNICQTNSSYDNYNTLPINELELTLEEIWNKIGVNEKFIKTFNNIKESFENDDEKKDFLTMEIENLKKIEKILTKLSNDMINREKTILLIKKLKEVIESQFIELNLNINEDILNDFYQAIIGYRINTIKVIENYYLFKLIFTYPIMRGKFNEEFILEKYHIKENYLSKMKNDLNFLGESKINGYKKLNIFFSKSDDPFLLSVTNKAPLKSEYYTRVQQCQYILLQEIIFNIVNNGSNLLNITDTNNENNDSKISKKKLEPISHDKPTKLKYKINTKENISCVDKKLTKDENNNKNLILPEKKNKIPDIINKNNKKFIYNDIYKNSKIDDQNEDQILNEINKNIDNIKKFSKKCENKKNNDKIIAIDKTSNKSANKNESDTNNDVKLIIIDENININDELDKKIKVLNINKKPDTIDNKKNDLRRSVMVNSLSQSKKLKPSQLKLRSATPEAKHKTNNKKNIDEKGNKENDLIKSINISMGTNNFQENYIAFYSGTLSNFINLYKTYYKMIPETQKIIFAINENPLMHLQNNYYPKIIICRDKKSEKIKGLCIFSYIFSNDPKYNNSLVIEHISSYNENEMQTIFEKLLIFIKENAYNNYINFYNKKNERIEKEIYIDLYYKYENQKYEINKNIRDFFKNTLNFKWVKLENKSKTHRYQKIKHVFIIDDKGNPAKDLLNNENDDNIILTQSRLVLKTLNDKDNDSNNSDNNSSKESIIENKKINNNSLNNFYIKNNTMLKFISNKEIKDNNQEEVMIDKDIVTKNDIRNVNPFNILYLSKQIKDETSFYDKIDFNIDRYFNTKDTNFINETFNKWDSTKLNDLLPKNSFYNSNIENLIKCFNENTNKDYFKIYSSINILPTFDNCISIKYNNINYNRIINKDLKLLVEKETNQLFYFIAPKDNTNILLISTNINSEFRNKFLNNSKNNINIDFINVYNNLIPYEEENDKKIILYLPSFKVKFKIFNENNHQNEKYSLRLYKESFDIECLNEDLLIKKCNKNCKIENVNNMNFDYDLKDNDEYDRDKFMINNDFLFVVANSNLIKNISSMPMMTLYVSKKDFINNVE